MQWPALTPDAVANTIETNASTGLTESEAAARLARDGPNEVAEHAVASWPQLLLAQFRDVMILLLLAAAAISVAVGDASDAWMIALIVVLNALIGFTQELRAARAVGELRKMAASEVTVIRGAVTRLLPARELVVGDLIRLEGGARVAADVRLTALSDLEVDESALTGESVAVHKTLDLVSDASAPLGDQLNMAFSGTIATRGSARGIVVATGGATEIGKIAGLISGVAPLTTPLQRRLARVSRTLALVAIAICVIVFTAGVLRGERAVLMLMTAISLAVAAIPEAMPAVVTVLLAIGARRMVRHQALIRRLPAVETLGSVTYICSDKTGTLTQNRMTVVDARAVDLPGLLTAMALCNDVDVTAADGAKGEPTEVALAMYAESNGFARRELELQTPRTATLSFTSDRKRMTTVHAAGDGSSAIAYTKGAPELLLVHAPELQHEAEAMARSGLRVIAFARRTVAGLLPDDTISADVEILGCVGLMDPARAESAPAIAACHAAGIATVMITGDHAETAESIAREIGIIGADDQRALLTGRDLLAMDDAALAERVLETRIYARVDPAQKIRIVAALQAKGQFVAMTGDGVNDAPALSQADIGVAMGRTGTDVAREAADLVLLDDNFASIVAAVREGRRIYDNIRKFIRYVLACNLAEVLVVFLAPFFALPLPLLPVQLLWINLVTDGVPGLALAAEPAEPDTMARPPQPPTQGLFDTSMWISIGVMGCVMALVTLLVQFFAASSGRQNDQTMVFTVLTLLQVGQALSVRSHTQSIFSLPILSNTPLLLALLLTIALQMAAIYTPIGNRLLHTDPLSSTDLGLCLVASTVGLIVTEVVKLFRRIAKRRASLPLTTARA